MSRLSRLNSEFLVLLTIWPKTSLYEHIIVYKLCEWLGKNCNREMQYWEAKSQIILILKEFRQGTIKKNIKNDSDYISGFWTMYVVKKGTNIQTDIMYS